MERLAWFIPLGLLSALLCVLLRRRAYRSHTFFFLYVSFAVSADVARFITLGHRTYFLTYWITEAGYGFFGLLVMYEVFRAVVGKLIRAWWGHLIFPAIAAISLGLSLSRAHDVPSQIGGVESYILTGEITIRFIQVFVFAGLVALVPLLGLRWRQHSFGIAAGFGLYSTVMLLTTVKFSDFGTRFTFLWGVSSLVAYSFTVVIWIWFFSAPQKPEAPTSELLAPTPGDLSRYKDALRKML